VELARALVSSSNFDGCILIGSFQAKPDADPHAEAALEAAPTFVYPVIAAGMSGNVKPNWRAESLLGSGGAILHNGNSWDRSSGVTRHWGNGVVEYWSD
jgi:hypothetical protein